MNAFLESFPFRQIQFQRAEAVREIEFVHDDSSVIRKCRRLFNVHAPCGEHAGHPGEKERAVGGNQRQFEPVAAARQLQLHRVFAQMIGHFHLIEDVACGLCAQIAPRQSVEKTFELFATRRRERAQMLEDFLILAAVHPFVHAMEEIIRGADIKLPDIFGLPRSERFRINGLDVGIGEQAKHFQAFGRADFLRKLLDGIGVENVTAERGAQFQVVRNEKQNIFAIGGIKFQAVEGLLCNCRAGSRVAIASRRLCRCRAAGSRDTTSRAARARREVPHSAGPISIAIAANDANFRWPRTCVHPL